ncbi:MAG TPA: 3-hydroxyacyl-CoA dehydrogenase NAD-binding domain-containing protein [Nitrososphaerales archaeon]|nr:3-hydroxyacyl-CoA dehydrogenase NAD-binding domain-containing protein [Nitrososphaerales archaeon]
MKLQDVKRVSVLGAGVMGHGIAEVAALSGYEVSLYDIKDEFVNSALQKVGWSLAKFAEKKTITEEKAKETLARIRGTADLATGVASADVVIEAAPEDLGIKRELFSKVDRLSPSGALFASNTSTLPIGEIASSTRRESQFVGLHFFNPPPLMPLVEVIRGTKTSQDSTELAVSLGRSFGKEVVLCAKDVPGFIVNRILGPLLNEAALVAERGQATVAQVDSMAVYKVGLPMGLFELADYSGIDTIYKAGEAVSSRDPLNVTVAPIFKQMYEEHKLGRKTGEGFYKYGTGQWERPAISRDAGRELDPLLVFSPAVNAAAWLVSNGVCTKEDLEKSVKLGLGFPEGILRMADRWGLDRVVASLEEKMVSYGPMYAPDATLLTLVKQGATGEKRGRGFFDYATSDSSVGEVIVKSAPPLGWLILNRPHRLNTLTQTLIAQLLAGAKSLEADPAVRVVVVRGEGERAFSAGADLTSFDATSPTKLFDSARAWFEAFSALERLNKPVIAAINGLALGGGCELALACDFRLASDDALIGLTEVHLGLIPGAGGTQRLARIVGIPKAKEMIFFAQRLGAEEALKVGLVNRVYKKSQFDAEVSAFATLLAKQPPLSLKFAKHAVSLSYQVPTDLGQLFEASSFGSLFSTQDASEGISALLEKREPDFKGE